jgi:hypothetical protein
MRGRAQQRLSTTASAQIGAVTKQTPSTCHFDARARRRNGDARVGLGDVVGADGDRLHRAAHGLGRDGARIEVRRVRFRVVDVLAAATRR